MSKWMAWVRHWVPAFLWAALIFAGSGNTLSAAHTSRFLVPFLRWLFPDLTAESIDWVHFTIRKCGHMTEYFILTVLIWRGLSGFNPINRQHWRKRHAILAWALAVTYAASDEFHQSFVSSRQASFRDVLFDATGALFGLVGAGLLVRWRRRRGAHAATAARAGVVSLEAT